MRFLFAWTLAFLVSPAFAVEVPKSLDSGGRSLVVRKLGLGTITKILTNPFPLGGYSGFEFGISMEQVDTREIAGNSANMQYPRFSIGKGLYNNLDLFLNFALPDSELTSYGVAVRYSFYEAKFLPISVGVIVHATHVNIKNDFSSLTTGADLVAGIYVEQFSLYLGAGQLTSTGTFIAGTGTDSTVPTTDPEINSLTNSANTRVRQIHTLGGITMHYESMFAAVQVDRTPNTTYSARVGMRF